MYPRHFSTEPGTPKILQFRGDLHPHDDQVVQVLGSIQYIVSTKNVRYLPMKWSDFCCIPNWKSKIKISQNYSNIPWDIWIIMNRYIAMWDDFRHRSPSMGLSVVIPCHPVVHPLVVVHPKRCAARRRTGVVQLPQLKKTEPNRKNENVERYIMDGIYLGIRIKMWSVFFSHQPKKKRRLLEMFPF